MDKFDKYFNGNFQSGGVQFGVGFDPNKYRPKYNGLEGEFQMGQEGVGYNGEKSTLMHQGMPKEYSWTPGYQSPKMDLSTEGMGVGTLGNHIYGTSINGEKAPEVKTEPKPEGEEDREFNQDMEIYQYDNPYGGIDMESAAMAIGEGLENGNYGMALAGAGKVGLSAWRNIASARASTRQRNREKATYYEKQRKSRAASPENASTFKLGGRFSTKFNR